jgi:hypothetical protein
MQSMISMVQTIFMDNKDNNQPLSVTTGIIGQQLQIGPNKQAYLPIALSTQPKLYFATAGAFVIPILLLNVPLPAQVWNAV